MYLNICMYIPSVSYELHAPTNRTLNAFLFLIPTSIDSIYSGKKVYKTASNVQ